MHVLYIVISGPSSLFYVGQDVERGAGARRHCTDSWCKSAGERERQRRAADFTEVQRARLQISQQFCEGVGGAVRVIGNKGVTFGVIRCLGQSLHAVMWVREFAVVC